MAIVIAFSCHLLQFFRLGWEEGFFMTNHMFNAIKCLISLVAAILAYLFTSYPSVFVPWLFISAVSTIYCYYLDLRNGWMLLEPQSKHCLLRKYLTFLPATNYYIIIIFNFLLRLSWMITISPAIVSSLGNYNLVTFITGAAEIIRRGIWNLLRV